MTETLNGWSIAWADFMWHGLIDGTLLLAIVFSLWLVLRRRAAAQVGYCLFLLVIFKLLVPVQLSVPGSLAYLSPRYAVEQLSTWAATASTESAIGSVDLEASESPSLARPKRVDPRRRNATSGPAEAAVDALAPAAPVDIAAPLSSTSWLMLGWLSIVSTLLARFCWAQWRMRHVIRHAVPLDLSTLKIDFRSLQKTARVRQQVQLVSSTEIGVPAVWGLFRPRLLLPTDVLEQLNSNQLTWVLLHELAHIRRADLLVAFVQRFAQILYFFHPAVWLANWLIDQQREYACDDAALAACSLPRHDCGQGFLRIVEIANSNPMPIAPALGLDGGLVSYKSFIRSRLMRILDTRRTVSPRLSFRTAAFLVAVAAIVLPQLQAQQKAADAKAHAADKSEAASQAGRAAPAIAPHVVLNELKLPAPVHGHSQEISPDGKKLLYVRNKPPQSEIAVLDLSTHKDATLVRAVDKERLLAPIWSPVGGQVAYTNWSFDQAAGKDAYSIRTVSTSGGEPQILFQRSENLYPVDWSHDGKWILAGAWTGEIPSLWFIPVGGGVARQLVEFGPDHDGAEAGHFVGDGRNAADGRIAPAGDKIAYQRKQDGQPGLFIFVLSTNREIEVATGQDISQYAEPEPVWSKDGRYLLYWRDSGDSCRLYAQQIKDNAPVGAPSLITKAPWRSQLRVSNDGRLFSQTDESAKPRLFSVAIDSQTGQIQSKPVVASDHLDSWTHSDIFLSPDGQSIAAPSWNEEGSMLDVMTISLDGKERRRIPVGLNALHVCGWFPDGKSLLISGFTKGTNGPAHFRLDLTAKSMEKLFGPRRGVGHGRLSPDGTRHASTIGSNYANGLFVRSVEPGAEPTLLRRVPGENAGCVGWSPDGKWIAFFASSRDETQRRLMLIPAAGGDAREIVATGPHDIYVNPIWSPDGKFITYASQRPGGGGNGVWLVKSGGGETVYLDLGVKHVFNWFWSLDGKSLLFSGTNDDDETRWWSLENYVPAE